MAIALRLTAPRAPGAALALGAALCAGAALGPAAGARAQAVSTDDLSAASFRPAPGPSAVYQVDGAEVAPLAGPYVGVVFDYAHRPLVVDCGSLVECDPNPAALVERLTQLHLMGSWVFGDRFQLSLVVPIAFVDGESVFFTRTGDDPIFNDTIRGGRAAGLGDIRLHGKLRLAGSRVDGAVASVVGWFAAPTGTATMPNDFVGDEPLTLGGHLAGQVFLGPVSAALNLGGILRSPAEVLTAKARSAMTFGIGLTFAALPILDVLAELTGAAHFGAADDQLEARIGGRVSVGEVRLGAAVGFGLADAPGVPDFRVLATGEWIPRPTADADGDGVPDASDPCPLVPEDADGHQDEDGCPDDDNDGDAVPDGLDACPDQPEDFDGFADEDGCPDDDNDGDGIPDGYDSCPDRPEDIDGERDDDGCPDDDADGDGVPTGMDLCPDEPEDTDGLADEDGCPEVDFDGDGIPDDRDECPEIPEDRDGRQDRDGCPE